MKTKLKLILPTRKYLKTFAKGMEEFRKDKMSRPTEDQLRIFRGVKDFPVYQKKMIANRKFLNLEKGKVPQTLYWAMIGKKFIGILKLRHRLNKKLLLTGGNIGYAVLQSERRKGYGTILLHLGLKKAKKLGIKKALLTCNDYNIASKKVIEANGGIFINKIKVGDDTMLRFWVPTKGEEDKKS